MGAEPPPRAHFPELLGPTDGDDSPVALDHSIRSRAKVDAFTRTWAVGETETVESDPSGPRKFWYWGVENSAIREMDGNRSQRLRNEHRRPDLSPIASRASFDRPRTDERELRMPIPGVMDRSVSASSAELYSNRNPLGPTIRTVTPDSIPDTHPSLTAPVYEDGPNTFLRSSPSSPHSTPRNPLAVDLRELAIAGNPDNPRPPLPPRPSLGRPGSSDRLPSLRNLRDLRATGESLSQSRPRTRTLDEVSREGPPTLLIRGRNRIGSVHSSSPTRQYQAMEETVTSIGHPSTVPAYALQSRSVSNRNRLVKSPPGFREGLSSATIEPVNVRPTVDNAATPVQATNARRILELMRSSCGKMEGRLAFRRGDVEPWTLAYCSVNEETGSLVYEMYDNKSDMNPKTLIPDLRGCQIRTGFDPEGQIPYLDVCPNSSNLEVHLRPHTQDEFDAWFAALLCWQPIRPKGLQNRMTKPQSPAISERRFADSRRHSEVSLLKEAPIIKVGKMTFWDTSVSHSNAGSSSRSGGRPVVQRMQSFASKQWRRVSCTLRENGELKLYSESDVTLVSVVQLSQLSRAAVQRLDPSVLDEEFCIAIYPQYTSTSTHISLIRPIVLSLDSRVQYEVWVVLLRAFTIPQLYGPKQPTIEEERTSPQTSPGLFTPPASDMFRMERSLHVRVIEARITEHSSPKSSDPTHNGRSSDVSAISPGHHYAEIQLDGETRARTMIKDGHSLFWREEFDFHDLPDVTSITSFIVKRKSPPPPLLKEKNAKDKKEKERERERDEARRILDVINAAGNPNGSASEVSFDMTVGKVDIVLEDLETNKEVEKWWPLTNSYGVQVGEALLKLEAEECVILMARDYQPLSEVLHRFANGLTLQIAHMIPAELRRLSDCLLNIFQVSGSASEWIMALVEEEIDGTVKETPVTRLRFARRMGSNDSTESFGSASEREKLVRDMGKNATLEANLLFRGNTLLTKSLDSHMKRLGKEYLEETLGEKLKEIAGKNPDCEVDPNRVAPGTNLDRTWKRLIGYTEGIWSCIAQSTSRCPPELRLIFRHIRACAEDRYGDFLRTVSYSSVSGFLFLRFFVPAILNPKLFGLLKDHPEQQARRTLTLIAKSLQGLANMSTFGAKERWMEPMNVFLSSHRQDFKTFIDNICSIPTSSSPLPALTPSYSTPIQILQRLPPTSREGFPSLPYLIDHARNFANLVSLWLARSMPMANNIRPSDGDLLKFHRLCVAINARTDDCLARAERAERPSSSQSFHWEELIEQLDHVSGIEAHQSHPSTAQASDFPRGPSHGHHHSLGSVSSAPGAAIDASDDLPPVPTSPTTAWQSTTNGSSHRAERRDRSASATGTRGPFPPPSIASTGPDFSEYTPPGSASGADLDRSAVFGTASESDSMSVPGRADYPAERRRGSNFTTEYPFEQGRRGSSFATPEYPHEVRRGSNFTAPHRSGPSSTVSSDTEATTALPRFERRGRGEGRGRREVSGAMRVAEGEREGEQERDERKEKGFHLPGFKKRR